MRLAGGAEDGAAYAERVRMSWHFYEVVAFAERGSEPVGYATAYSDRAFTSGIGELVVHPTCRRIVTAWRIRSIPSGVLGPVLRPPWSRQRPFFMAGDWQRYATASTPHFATSRRLPRGLPFLSQPARCSAVCLTANPGRQKFQPLGVAPLGLAPDPQGLCLRVRLPLQQPEADGVVPVWRRLPTRSPPAPPQPYNAP